MENSLFQNAYNPDVLSCIANLSNDEVFTPPELANKIIDMLPQELFENPDTTFLDPCCKSGVFLREIAKRLIKGLEQQIPDLEKRIEHIFSKQLFGIAITELTSLLSRRSVYCSKYPSGEFSVYQFPEEKSQGNIIFQRIRHTWKDGKCIYCGASQNEYDRGAELENHAYQFIHNLDVNKVFNMKFDVIIGNPPYQMSDGGGTGSSAMPIYHKFIINAKKLNPRYLTMIIPSRWFTGGKGLDEFRDEMLHDEHIREIHDFGNANDCFPGVAIEGGVCYFLWNRDQKGLCKVYSHSQNQITAISERPLLEKGADVFIGVSAPGTVTEEMVKTMAKDPILFPMANPVPEIMPDLAMKAGAAVVGTGRSDFPNQINNVLAFPGIFRGALDVRAKDINDPMNAAAAHAIANLIDESELRADYIIPDPFDPRVKEAVSAAVAKAARETGTARI